MINNILTNNKKEIIFKYILIFYYLILINKIYISYKSRNKTDDYKRKFIEFLLQTGALKVFENPSDDRTLKSKRISPWFVNIGDFNKGSSSTALAGFYADAVINSGVEVDALYGIPEKGVGLATPVAMSMAAKGHDVAWCFSRKDEKTHGEATNLAPSERAKKLLVGRVPEEGQAICQLDDVFTAGDAKYEANTFLKSLGRENLPLLVIDVDNPGHGMRNEDRNPNDIAGYNRRTREPITIEQYETKRRKALSPLP